MNRRLLALILSCVFGLAAACSGSDGAGADKDANGDGPAGDVDGGAAGDGSGKPGDEVVEPGGPASLQLALDPEKPAYKPGDKAKLVATVLDSNGTPLEGFTVGAPTIDPPALAEVTANGAIQFNGEGKVAISTCVVGAPGVCGKLETWCDGTGPTIVVDEPPRGAMLAGYAVVTVKGSVTDSIGGIAAVAVNGTPVQLLPDFRFHHDIQSAQGMNVVEVTAEDNFGNQSATVRSYLYSTEYHSIYVEAPELSLIPNGVMVYTDDLLYYNPQNPGSPDTVSYLLEVILEQLDLNSLVPNPVVQDQDLSVICLWGKYDISLHNISWSKPVVKLWPVLGGLQLDLTIPNFHGEFSLDTDAFGCADFWGIVEADAVKVQAKVLIVADGNGGLAISVPETGVEFENLTIGLGGIPGTLLNWLIDLFSGTVADLLEDQFKSMLDKVITDLTDNLTGLFAKPIEIPLDPFIPGNQPILLKVLVRMTQSNFDEQGGELKADLAIVSEKKIPLEPPGAIGRASCLSPQPENFQLDKTTPSPLELAAHIDVVNEALFSLWYNGGLNLTITSAALAEMGTDVSKYGVKDLDMVTAPLLPPVITTCNADNVLTAQIGDFLLDGKMVILGKDTQLKMYLFLEMSAVIQIQEGENGKEIVLLLNDPKVVKTDLVEVNDVWKGNESMITGLITDTAVPMLIKQFQEKPLTIPAPAFNLGELLGSALGEAGAAKLSQKELVLDLKEISNLLGYIFIRSGILVRDAPPPAE
jgi:hypothetical protein